MTEYKKKVSCIGCGKSVEVPQRIPEDAVYCDSECAKEDGNELGDPWGSQKPDPAYPEAPEA